MKDKPTILAVMTPFPHSIEEHKPVGAAKKMMEDDTLQHLAVTKNGKLVGLLTHRDIRLMEAIRKDMPEDTELQVKDVCERDPYVVDTHARLDHVALHMASAQLDSALVLREGKLAGIFTSVDACRVLGESLSDENDDDIPDEIA